MTSFIRWGANIPPDFLDYLQAVSEANPKLGYQELREQACECRDAVTSARDDADAWIQARRLFMLRLPRLYPGVTVPDDTDHTVALLNQYRTEVLGWTRNRELARALEYGLPEAADLLSAEVVSRRHEPWVNEPVATAILYILRVLNEPIHDRTEFLISHPPLPLHRDGKGVIRSEVALDDSTYHLVMRSYDGRGDLTDTADIVPVPFLLTHYADTTGADWYEWPDPSAGGKPTPNSATSMYLTRSDLMRHVRETYNPYPRMMRGLALWLDQLPVYDRVSTRLELRFTAPEKLDDESRANRSLLSAGWWVPDTIGRRFGGRSDATGIVSRWFRRRSREVCEARYRRLLQFVTTDKHRAILAYVAGSVVARHFRPNSPVPVLNLVGESGVGKTHFTRAAIAVLWGIGDAAMEYVGGDAIHSGFRRADYFSATDFPLLIDEASLTKNEREQMRSISNGTATSRGGSDLKHRVYTPRAPSVWTSNIIPDVSDSSSNEQHGDERRSIQVEFDSDDRAAIEATKREFSAFVDSLPNDPVVGEDDFETDSGGYALFRLNDIFRKDPEMRELVEIAQSHKDDREKVLDLGAAILGLPRIQVAEPRHDSAAVNFLEWLRGEAARWVDTDDAVKRSRDTIRSRISVLTEANTPAYSEGEICYVMVTTLELGEYQAYRRRMGLTSPYHALTDLASLGDLTGQTKAEILGVDRDRAKSRGHVMRIRGVLTRAARIKVAYLPSHAESNAPVVTLNTPRQYAYPDPNR